MASKISSFSKGFILIYSYFILLILNKRKAPFLNGAV
nr:MAG TPA: hypothetical protein [Caudoviricetes sp.]